MAKRKKPIPKWLRGLSPADILKEIDYIKASVKLARKFSTEFSSNKGFNLSKVEKIHPSKLAKLRRTAPYIREIQGTPHKVVRPRKKQSFTALRKHTRQKFPGQKAFFVHTEKPATTKVDVHKGTVRVKRKVKEGYVTQRYFYLPRIPQSFEDIGDMLDKLLPKMPEGQYVVIDSMHGAVGGTVSKSLLKEEMQLEWTKYDQRDLESSGAVSFAKGIVGFRWVGKNKAAERWSRENSRERFLYQQHRRRRERQSKRALLVGRR